MSISLGSGSIPIFGTREASIAVVEGEVDAKAQTLRG